MSYEHIILADPTSTFLKGDLSGLSGAYLPFQTDLPVPNIYSANTQQMNRIYH